MNQRIVATSESGMGYSSIEKTSRLPECSLGGLVCNVSYLHPQHGLCRSEATGLMNGTKPSAKTELGNSKYAFLDLSLGASPEFGQQGLDGGGEAELQGLLQTIIDS
jgi:hypothetical protein